VFQLQYRYSLSVLRPIRVAARSALHELIVEPYQEIHPVLAAAWTRSGDGIRVQIFIRHLLSSFCLCLLGQNPGHNLMAEKDDLSARPGAEVRHAFRQQPLPYAPDRAADQAGYFPDSHGLPQIEVLASIWGGFRGG
jgi:hypothetical protein